MGYSVFYDGIRMFVNQGCMVEEIGNSKWNGLFIPTFLFSSPHSIRQDPQITALRTQFVSFIILNAKISSNGQGSTHIQLRFFCRIYCNQHSIVRNWMTAIRSKYILIWAWIGMGNRAFDNQIAANFNLSLWAGIFICHETFVSGNRFLGWMFALSSLRNVKPYSPKVLLKIK